MGQVIEIRDVSKSFYDEVLFDHVTLDVPQGDIVGFIGENGCGKSVLFQMICGLISPEEGSIKVFDRMITDGKFPESTGVMLDGAGFIPYYSGYDNLKNIAVIDRKIGEKEIRESMQLVGLNPGSKKPVKKYSLGMKQRLGIAMALMEKPRLLLLDEPMNALDKEMVGKVRNLLIEKNKKEQLTILLTSHNEKDIEVLCKRVYRVENSGLVSV